MRDLFKKIFREEVMDDDISIEVSESEGVRSLHFASHAIQSSMRIKKPFHLELIYQGDDDVFTFPSSSKEDFINRFRRGIDS